MELHADKARKNKSVVYNFASIGFLSFKIK